MTAKAKRLWVLVTPRGRVCWETLAATKGDVWSDGFSIVANNDPTGLFGIDYWKRWDASMREARRRGYRFARVRCEVEE